MVRVREGSCAPSIVVGHWSFVLVGHFQKRRKAMVETIIVQVIVALLVAAITGQFCPCLM